MGFSGSHIPIRAESEAHAVIQESAKRVSAAGAIVADALFGPTAIVDGVIRLDRGDHAQLREAVEILCRHVLRVLDAEAAVALAVGFTISL